LEHKHATPSTSVAVAGQAPYPGNQYSHTYPPPAQYPAGYSQDSPGGATTNEDTGEGSDAWEAAQNILKAINFGSLIQMDQKEAQGGSEAATSSSAVNPTVQEDGVLPQADTAGVDHPSSTGPDKLKPSVELGAQDRAALQAQLALLAAQMVELAEGEEDSLARGLSTAMVGRPITQAAANRDNQVDDEGNEDMERVDVPVASSDALRTWKLTELYVVCTLKVIRLWFFRFVPVVS
jgi:hypothetical protein